MELKLPSQRLGTKGLRDVIGVQGLGFRVQGLFIGFRV